MRSRYAKGVLNIKCIKYFESVEDVEYAESIGFVP